MPWQECKRCHRKMLSLGQNSSPHDGYCGECYEIITGKCAECNGTGWLQRAHLGSMECARCEGTGQTGIETDTPDRNG